jgi:hypothetical protein
MHSYHFAVGNFYLRSMRYLETKKPEHLQSILSASIYLKTHKGWVFDSDYINSLSIEQLICLTNKIA